MIFYNIARNRQSQAGASQITSRGKKGLGNFQNVPLRDPHSRVDDLKDNRAFVAGCTDLDAIGPIPQGVACVGKEIDDHLFDLLLASFDRG
jgi:hypothetical protein